MQRRACIWIGFAISVFSLFLIFIVKYNHFYELLLIGLFLMLFFAPGQQISKKTYFLLYFYFFLIGLIIDLFLGLSVCKLWTYPYKYLFEYIFIYVVIYPIGGLVMLKSFLLFERLLTILMFKNKNQFAKNTSEDFNNTNIKIFLIVSLVIFSLGIIITNYYQTFKYYGVLLFFFSYMTLFWLINFEAEKYIRSYLSNIQRAPFLFAVATIVTAYTNGFIHEYPNTFAHQWKYQGLPFQDMFILHIPITAFLGWPLLVIIPISVYYFVLAQVNKKKK